MNSALCLCLCFHRMLVGIKLTSGVTALERLNVSDKQTTWRWPTADDARGHFSTVNNWGNVSTTSSSPPSPLVSSTALTTTTFPSIEEVQEIFEESTTIVADGDNRRNSPGHIFGPSAVVEDEEPIVVKRESWFQKIKDLFRPPIKQQQTPANEGTVLTEKYGSGSGGYPQPSAHLPLYQGHFQNGYGSSSHPLHHPDGGYAPVFKPDVSLSLTADFIELNCAAHGRIQQGIRWVKLVHGLNSYGHQLFATVADGERILFDTYHFGVRTDGRKSRLIIRNPDPRTHYGVYQCQVSVAGNPSLIVKEEFVVGRIT